MVDGLEKSSHSEFVCLCFVDSGSGLECSSG